MYRPCYLARLAAAAVLLAALSACPGPSPDPLELVSTALPDGTAGHPYSAQVEARGGTTPRTFSATGAPSGLTFASDGRLSGTSTASGDFTLSVTVSDSAAKTAQRDFPLKLFPALSFATTTLPDGNAGSTYLATISVTGGKAPVTVALTAGTLPPGLSFSTSSSAISGTPTAGGNSTLTFVATDSNGATSTITLSLLVTSGPAITTSTLADGYTGRAYAASLSGTGGQPPYQWTITAGSLPAGLSLASNGGIVDTPTATGSSAFIVELRDAASISVTRSLTLEVFIPPALTSTSCADGYRTESYSNSWPASGGKAPLTWALTSGSLPPGLSLNGATGAISGSPSATTSQTLGFTVADANGVSAAGACQLSVYDLPEITNAASPLPDVTAGANETGSIATTGGKPPLTWAPIGALPTGLSLNPSNGTYSGTVAAGVTNGQTFTFDVQLTDDNGRQDRETFTVTAYRRPVIDTTSLADATEYAAYGPTSIQAREGKAPLTFAATGLPSGLSIDSSTGVISGTPPPTSRGTYPLTLTVTDSGGRIATSNITLLVRPGTPTITSTSPGFGSVSGGAQVTLTGSNFFGAAVTVGGQAATVTVSPDGASLEIRIPPGSGPGAATISVTNSSGLGATTAYVYTLERTIDPDGVSTDWLPGFRVGTNASPGAPGSDLDSLSVAYDHDNLYVAVSGPTNQGAGDVLLLWIDRDPGAGTGITDFSTLADDNGFIDAACTNNGTGTGQYVRANTRFAPEFCLGNRDLQNVPLGANWPSNEYGGLRSLVTTTDFGWAVDYQGRNLVAMATGITASGGFSEFIIPWAVLYSGRGAPPPGGKIALAVRLVDSTGNLIANQTLPQDDDANPHRLSQIVEVDLLLPSPADPGPWYRGSVFYEAYVRSFQDSTGDGIGDLAGLASRLDYLNDGDPATTTDLGVDALWLMPIFDSPSVHGYDATDYEQIDPDYGDLAGFQALVTAAHQRGMKVYLDLVLNHTSDQHPWFIDSASSPASPRRDWYVWSPTDLGWTQPWSTDPVWHLRNGAWYYALFFHALPDLNYRSQGVRDEMKRIAGLWLQRGADGYRLDATPYLVENGPGTGQLHQPQTLQYLREIGAEMNRVNPESAVVAENWTDTLTIARYYGSRTARGGDGVQMSFNFPLADRIREAISTGNGIAIGSKLVELRASYPVGAVDAPFLSNHDQLRIATQLGNDPSRLRLAAALLLTLPGAPFLYYGEELGAQNHTLPGDESKRAPMAWDGTAGGGFTTGTPWFPFAPGQAEANVAAQAGDPASLLSRYRQLIRARKQSPALSTGQGLEVLSPMFGNDPLLVFIRQHGAERVVVAHNLADVPVTSTPYVIAAGSLAPLFTDPGATATGGTGAWTLALPPRGSAVWRVQESLRAFH